MGIAEMLALKFCLLLCISSCFGQLTNDKDLLLNWCLNSTLHKEKPSKEDSLHQQCLPWKDKSCCTEGTTKNIHEVDVHNFNLNHCFDEMGTNISKKCRQHFIQDNCFYECEPHIGLWVVKTTRKISTERFLKVPLCASDCNAWWDACKDDFTCVFNWPKNFKFRKGVNYCPDDHKCQTFELVYKDAQTFCENVWNHSWKYTPDSEPCMKMWFNGTIGNPNRRIAEFYINERFGGASSIVSNVYVLLLITVVVVLIWQ